MGVPLAALSERLSVGSQLWRGNHTDGCTCVDKVRESNVPVFDVQ